MMCFVILHYMVDKETIKCVDSIIKLNGKKKIIIVDNYSPNDSIKKLQEKYGNNKDVVLIKNVQNAGYANGCNLGYEYIKNEFKNCNFITIMNNDMEIVQNDFIEKVFEIYKTDKFYVLGPDIYSTSSKIHQNPEMRTIRTYDKVCAEISKMNKISDTNLKIKGFLKKLPYLEKIVKKYKNRKRKRNNYQNMQYNKTLHGSCLIFSEKFINQRAYAFYPKTKFYCEAQILDYQCQRNNWLTIYSPKISVLHHEDIATNASFSTYFKKSKFMNDSMINSLKEFKKLMEDDIKGGKNGN